MELHDAVVEILANCRAGQLGRGSVYETLLKVVEMVQEDCAKSCEKTAENWSANNDDYKDVALTCAEDIRKIRYLIRN